jgi:hypothetical protein
LPHGARHFADGRQDFARPCDETRTLGFLSLKFCQIVWRILLRRENGPKYRAQESRGANVERKTHGERNRPRSPGSRHVKNIGQQVRQCRGNHRTKPDEETLHGKAARALKLWQQVGDKRTKGFHADVDAGVENPQQTSGHPECGTARHQDERHRTQNRTGQKIGTAPAQRAPGAVAGVADDRLHDQACQRRGQPENRNLIGPCAQVFVDGTHVRHL